MANMKSIYSQNNGGMIFSENDNLFDVEKPKKVHVIEDPEDEEGTNVPFANQIFQARCSCGNLHPIFSIPKTENLKALKRKVHNLSSEVTTKSNQVGNLKKKLREVEENNSRSFSEEIMNYKHKIKVLNQNVTDTKEKLKNLSDISSLDKKKLEEQHNQISELNKMYHRILVERKQFQNTIKAWENNQKNLEIENKRLYEKLNDTTSKHQQELKTIITQQKQDQAPSNEENEQIKALKRRNVELKRRNKTLEKNYENIVRSQNLEIQSLMRTARGKTGRVFYASNLKYGKNYKITELNSQQLWSELRKTIIQLRERNVQLAKQIMGVTGSKNKEAEKWQLKFETMFTKNQDLEKIIEKMKTFAENATFENEALQKELGKIKKDKAVYESKIFEMKEDYTTLLDMTKNIQTMEQSKLMDGGGATGFISNSTIGGSTLMNNSKVTRTNKKGRKKREKKNLKK